MASNDWYNGMVIDIGDRCSAVGPITTEEMVSEMLMALNSGRGRRGYTPLNLNIESSIKDALRRCSPIPAIITQKAFAFVKGVVTVWNPNNGKPVRGEFKEWELLFRKPNRYQSQRQFLNRAYSYMQRYGYCLIEPKYGPGIVDRPYELHVIANDTVTWEWGYSGTRNTKPTAAYENINGERRKLDIEKLIIIRDPASIDYQDNGFLPLSRAADLEAEIANHVHNMEARGEMLTDRGANGMVSNTGKDAIGHVTMDPEEKDRVQAAYKRYGVMRGQDKIIVTDAPLSYTPMTFDVTQLGLHPEHIANIKAICNRYAFPFTMLAEGFEGKYNNSTTARRDFQDTTIDPESTDFFEQLSLGLKMYDQKCEAYMDYSGVASVQASQEERGKGLQAMNNGLEVEWNNGLITRNEWLDELGKARVINPLFDKYKWELTPEQLGAVVNNKPEDDGKGNEETNSGTEGE